MADSPAAPGASMALVSPDHSGTNNALFDSSVAGYGDHPGDGPDNTVIWIAQPQAPHHAAAMISHKGPPLVTFEAATGVPFYLYDAHGDNRRENISDRALAHFRDHYGSVSIDKWMIFYYVYGLLHHPAYRERYAENRQHDLPRIPFAPDFHLIAQMGKQLASIHLDIANAQPYPLAWLARRPVSFRAGAMELVEAAPGDGGLRALAAEAASHVTRDPRQRRPLAETLLWEALREGRLAGLTFAQHVPVPDTDYVVDFLCAEAGLVVEIDGGPATQQVKHDPARLAAVAGHGWRVARFHHRTIKRDLEGVLLRVLALTEALTLNPSPTGEGLEDSGDGVTLESGNAIQTGLDESRDEGAPASGNAIQTGLEDAGDATSPSPSEATGRGGRGVRASKADSKALAAKAMIQIARDLRQRQTPAETLLWEALRDRRLAGLKFRRQHAIPNTAFVVDFFCHEAGLVVELDGGVHARQVEDDAARQAAIEAEGWEVVRFSNQAVQGDLEGVLGEIIALTEALTPKSPLPQARGLEDARDGISLESGNAIQTGLDESRDGVSLESGNAAQRGLEDARDGDSLESGNAIQTGLEDADFPSVASTPSESGYGVAFTDDGIAPSEERQSPSPVGEGFRVRALIFNDTLTLGAIPPEAFAYRLGDRSALEWIVSELRGRSDAASDPQVIDDDDRYAVDLVEKAVRVSLQTVEMVERLAKLPIAGE